MEAEYTVSELESMFKNESVVLANLILEMEGANISFDGLQDLEGKQALTFEGYTLESYDTNGNCNDGADVDVILLLTQISTGDTVLIRYPGYYSSWGESEVFPEDAEQVFLKRVVREEYLSEREIEQEGNAILGDVTLGDPDLS